VAKTKLSKTKVMALMEAETWMEPKEAVELGFADEVGSSKKAKAAATNSFDLSLFRNVPKDLKVELVAEPEPVVDDPLIGILRHRLEMLRA
jgi:ATP-dependent Clp protease protease subunit